MKKKRLLLLVPVLLLAACNGKGDSKYVNSYEMPYKEVIIPEAKEITEEQARSLTSELVTEYNWYKNGKRIPEGRYDYNFHCEKYSMYQKEGDIGYTKDSYVQDFKHSGTTEMYFLEKNNYDRNQIDTTLIHKHTEKYGHVIYINKYDPDFLNNDIYALTEKHKAFSAGSMLVSIRYYAEDRMVEAYNSLADYNKFFEFVNDNPNQDVKYYSRGKGSVIMECKSTIPAPTGIKNVSSTERYFKMEFFENLLVNYEYTEKAQSEILKHDLLTLTYERPEIELPEYWVNNVVHHL